MTLNSTDILKIQTAIDRYEKRVPRKPSPSADDALAWQAGKRRSLPQSNTRDRSELRHPGIWFRSSSLSESGGKGMPDQRRGARSLEWSSSLCGPPAILRRQQWNLYVST
jgi:hypothetical protein